MPVVASEPRPIVKILVGIPLLLVALAALVLPALASVLLVRRGVVEGRPGWAVLGALIGLSWLASLFGMKRKIARMRAAGKL
jgi:hypothetical protein